MVRCLCANYRFILQGVLVDDVAINAACLWVHDFVFSNARACLNSGACVPSAAAKPEGTASPTGPDGISSALLGSLAETSKSKGKPP